MPLPIIADTMRVAVEGLATNNHAWANVMHFRKSGALSFAGAIAILDPILLAHYQTNSGGGGQAWRSQAPTSSTLTQSVYTPLDGVSASTIITHALAGLDAGDPLPASIALVTTLRTSLRGRSHRGRVYQGPLTEAYNLAGRPIAGLVAGQAVQWNALIAALAGTGVSLVVASYKLVTAQDVLTCTVDARWDTQRRRLNA